MLEIRENLDVLDTLRQSDDLNEVDACVGRRLNLKYESAGVEPCSEDERDSVSPV